MGQPQKQNNCQALLKVGAFKNLCNSGKNRHNGIKALGKGLGKYC
jgi:hypothetical protein